MQAERYIIDRNYVILSKCFSDLVEQRDFARVFRGSTTSCADVFIWKDS